MQPNIVGVQIKVILRMSLYKIDVPSIDSTNY